MNEKSIRCEIERSFSAELSHGRRLSHSECVALRSQLALLDLADLKECLPQVLIDLLESHTDDYRNTEDIEDVVWFLMPVEQGEGAFGLARIGGEGAKLVHSASEKIQKSLNPDQRAAIAHWLKVALEWEDLLLRREEVELAVRYWERTLE
jgi:hypothetical protein